MALKELRKGLSALRRTPSFPDSCRVRVTPLRRRTARINRLVILAAAGVLAGCAAGESAGGNARDTGDLGRQQLVLPAAPPVIAAQDETEVARAMRLAERFNRPALESQRRSRTIEAVQTPLLYEAPAGRRFLEAPGARALALGEPPEICPAIGLATSAQPAPRAESAERALTDCLAMLKKSGASAECGCRLVAIDDTLLAEQGAFAYARGVTAQFIGHGAELSAIYVAEERAEEDGSGDVRIWFLDALGPRAVARLTEAGEAELAMLQGANGELEATRYFRGRWESEGFRRGRLAEKLYLEDEKGERLIALIGYSPAELAAREAELGDWHD